MAQAGSASKSQGFTFLKGLAYTSSVVGGGVVGRDYAVSMEIDPFFGMVLGSVISTVVTKILYHLKENKATVRNVITGLCALAGAVAGALIAAGAEASFGEGVFAFVFGGIVGSLLGQMMAIVVDLAVLALLFVGRGPVAMWLQNLAKEEGVDSSVTFVELTECASSLLLA